MSDFSTVGGWFIQMFTTVIYWLSQSFMGTIYMFAILMLFFTVIFSLGGKNK